jgi:hypothetical protein
MTRTEVSISISELSELSQTPGSCHGSKILSALFLVVATLWILPALCWGQMAQTIAFTQLPSQQAYAGTSVVLAATATSGLPVSFSVVSGPAQVSGINGSTLTYTGVGMVVVQADQVGGNGYSPAPPVQAPVVTVALLTEPVTTLSTSVSTVVTFTNPGTLAQISALTQGVQNLDFSNATGLANPTSAPCVAELLTLLDKPVRWRLSSSQPIRASVTAALP